jgi:hypothetical protein
MGRSKRHQCERQRRQSLVGDHICVMDLFAKRDNRIGRAAGGPRYQSGRNSASATAQDQSPEAQLCVGASREGDT